MRIGGLCYVAGLVALLLYGCGPSATERGALRDSDAAAAAQKQAEARASAAEADAASLRERLTVVVKERDKAKADLDTAKQAMIDLQAEARKADERLSDAEARASADSASRRSAEAAASARAREAAEARARLAEERNRPEPETPAVEEPPAKQPASGKAVAACAAIAETINLRRDLTDPAALDPSYLEWLVSDGGWDSRDVADLGVWIRWVKAGPEITESMTKKQATEVKDTWEKHLRALVEVRDEFLNGDTKEALRTFRYWRPRVD